MSHYDGSTSSIIAKNALEVLNDCATQTSSPKIPVTRREVSVSQSPSFPASSHYPANAIPSDSLPSMQVAQVTSPPKRPLLASMRKPTSQPPNPALTPKRRTGNSKQMTEKEPRAKEEKEWGVEKTQEQFG